MRMEAPNRLGALIYRNTLEGGALLGRKALNRIITAMMTLFLRGQV